MEKETELYLIKRIKDLENLIAGVSKKESESAYYRAMAFDMLADRLEIQVICDPVKQKYTIRIGKQEFEADFKYAELIRRALDYGKQ